MKNKLFLYVSFIFILAACDKLDKYTQFDLDVDETVEINSMVGINLPFNISTPKINTNSESTFAINDTRKDLVEVAKIKSLHLIITNPSNADFSFLKSIIVFLSAEGLPEVKVAWNENIPDEVGNTLDLETSNENFQEYVKKDQVELRVNTITDEIISSNHQIFLHSVFFIDAKILGQ